MFDIAPVARDLALKGVAYFCKSAFLEHFGVTGPPIVMMAPTELSLVTVREKRLDFLFVGDDGSYLHLEFQSSRAAPKDMARFALYDAMLYHRDQRRIRTVIFYTDGVQEAPDRLDTGVAVYQTENVYLARFDGDTRLERLLRKVEDGEPLDTRSVIDMIFLSHMRAKEKGPAERVLLALRMARHVTDPQERTLCLAAILGIGGHFLNREQEREAVAVLQEGQNPLANILAHAIAERSAESHAEGLAEGLKQGLKEGRKEGRTEGLAEGRAKSIVMFLEARFGEIPFEVSERILAEHRVEQLARLLSAAARATDLAHFREEMTQSLGN